MDELIQFQENASGLFVRAQGHITAAVSADLRDMILERLSLPPPPILLAVDLQACDYMDSTFMGLLVGFHKRFKALTGTALTILRPTQDCVKLLSGLGILKLMVLVEEGEFPSPTLWKPISRVHKPTTEFILSAHKNLSELSPENTKAFGALQSVLEQQIKKEEV